MIKDPQEYLQEWEKKNNPFYPSEMRWDRVKVNTFLKDWKEQCNIAHVVGRSEQLVCQCSTNNISGVVNGVAYCEECELPKAN